VYFAPNFSDTGSEIARVDHLGIHVGGIGGTSFEIAPDADLFLDYRYRHVNARSKASRRRSARWRHMTSPKTLVMAGVRFYMVPGDGRPAAPAYYPPPQPQYQYSNSRTHATSAASSWSSGGGHLRRPGRRLTENLVSGTAAAVPDNSFIRISARIWLRCVAATSDEGCPAS